MVNEDSISLLASALPAKLLIAAIVTAVVAAIIYYMLPLRLIGTLVAAIDEAEETYVEAHESGLVTGSAAETEILYRLQVKVSTTIEDTLRNSLSWHAALHDFLLGRTFTLLRCIREVQRFETRIKILKEYDLRAERNSSSRAIFLRRRGAGPRQQGSQSRRLA
ncbi:hypothetical protein MVEN_01786900 [Mycena venus]|uniref:Uncharacterized protein n=1 Tax=Mycena venus TaxID=2733690 RepID=A0A8H7CNQ8_9AGAR|nr:hypothetical protein MVEN_01786900 [Mycena venus]